MRLRSSTILKAALVCAGGSAASAQSGDLSSVTMRVLDDVADVDAVILELDANRGAGEEGAEGDGRRARGDEGGDAGGDAEQGPSERAEEDDLVERPARDELHDPDEDERSEGKLEDNDVERPAVPPTP